MHLTNLTANVAVFKLNLHTFDQCVRCAHRMTRANCTDHDTETTEEIPQLARTTGIDHDTGNGHRRCALTARNCTDDDAVNGHTAHPRNGHDIAPLNAGAAGAR